MYEEQTELEALYHGIHEMEDERDTAIARAEAGEKRIATLEEQLEICNRALRNTQDSCIAAGDRAEQAEAARWRELHADRDNDLKHEFDRANALEAEVERLREGRALLSEVYNAFGYTWPQRYAEDVGAFLETSGRDDV